MAISERESLAQKRVLVLNASYEPIKIVNWQRALLLCLADKVDVVDLHDTEVHSVSQAFTLPSVIRIRQYISRKKKPSRSVGFSRSHIFLRDHHKCQYCHEQFSTKELTLDHVMPAVRGGPKTWENLVTSCKECNQRKGSKTPEEANMPLQRKPSMPPMSFLPDLLYLRKGIPESWKPYLAYIGHLLAS